MGVAFNQSIDEEALITTFRRKPPVRKNVNHIRKCSRQVLSWINKGLSSVVRQDVFALEQERRCQISRTVVLGLFLPAYRNDQVGKDGREPALGNVEHDKKGCK